MHLFWERGYCETSMDEMVQRTGVSRYGLYSAFGGKRELFLAALDVYIDEHVHELTAPLRVPDAALGAIDEFLDMFTMMGTHPRAKLGCLACNAVAEFGLGDTDIGRRTDRYFRLISGSFHHALKNASARQQVKGDALEAIADRLTATIVGVSIMAKGEVGRTMVSTILASTKSSIPRT